MASRSVRDLLITGGRRAAMEEATARQERLRRFAGTESPSLTPTPVRPIASGASGRSSSSAGPSAPAPRGWSAPNASRSGAAALSSTRRGDPAAAEQQKSLRAASRVHDAAERDPLAADVGLTILEEKAVKPASTPGYQRSFRLFLVFLATLGTWNMVNGEVQPSEFGRVAKRDPSMIDSSLLDYYDYLYFSGSMSHEAEKAKAAVLHYANHLVALRDLGRSSRALQGFRKIAPGTSRFPLPRPILGALAGQLRSEGHHEIALALILMFVCNPRPAELFMLMVCDVVTSASTSIINLASGDTFNVTKTGRQDEGVSLENDLFSLLKDALLAHIHSLGFTDSTMRRATRSLWTFGHAIFKEAVCRAAAALGLPDGFCLYMARHGGVTTDLLEKFRSWAEGQARGRWHSETTLKRYVKPGVVARYLNSCEDEVIAYGEKLLSKPEVLLQVLKSEKDVMPPTVQRPGHGAAAPKSGPLATKKRAAMKAASAMKAMKKVADGVVDTALVPMPEKPVAKTMKAMKKVAVAIVDTALVPTPMKSIMKTMKVMKVMRAAPSAAPPAMKVMKKAMKAVKAMKAMKTMRVMRALPVVRKPAARVVPRRPAHAARRRPAAARRR